MTWVRPLAVAAAASLLLVGCSQAGARRAEPSATTGKGSGVDAARAFRSARGYTATPDPVRIEIPRIGVSSALVRLGRAANGTVDVPDPEVAGWYAPGTRPGDPGSAVILGHVDSNNAPAVFYRLRELRRGDEVLIRRADGSTLRFVVQRTQQYPKARFPTDEVYYPTLAPELRLVTCGGEFDYNWHHYKSNVIVFARMQT